VGPERETSIEATSVVYDLTVPTLQEASMATPYTVRKLTDIEDSAPKSGFGDVQEARFAKDALDTEDTGFSYHRVKAGQRQPFAHKHERAEEVYVVLAGSGRVKLDEEVVELQTLDAIRVAPTVTRAFEAGPSGLDLIVFGPRCDGDGEVLMGWWAD
jgi:mannose-6-phosphate isomerase-like protein (cupin superfamily)